MTTYLLRGDPDLLERYRPALATLPVTFRATAVPTDSEVAAADTAAITVIDGADPAWADAAERTSGGVVIVDLPICVEPVPERPVVLALPWAGSAVALRLPAIGPEVRMATADFELGAADERTLAGCAMDLATLLARVASGPLELDPPRETGSVITASGRVGGAAVQISGVRSAAGRGAARVTWRGVDRDVVIDLPAPGTAWPGRCTVHSAAGSRTDPLRYSDFRREALLAAIRQMR